MRSCRHPADQHGIGLIEILLVLAIVALAGFLLMRYVQSAATTVEKLQEEKPLGHARLAVDQATLTSLQSLVRAYHAQHGRWPADKTAVLALGAGSSRFQCAGNDVEYDPGTGTLELLITDAGRC